MEEGKLARWTKSEGDEVRSGDVIAEIETDKATMEVEAVDEGKLGRILVPAGTEGVKVNTPIAVILTDGEDASALANGYAGEGRLTPAAEGQLEGSFSPRGEGQDEGGLAPAEILVKDPLTPTLSPRGEGAGCGPFRSSKRSFERPLAPTGRGTG